MPTALSHVLNFVVSVNNMLSSQWELGVIYVKLGFQYEFQAAFGNQLTLNAEYTIVWGHTSISISWLTLTSSWASEMTDTPSSRSSCRWRRYGPRRRKRFAEHGPMLLEQPEVDGGGERCEGAPSLSRFSIFDSEYTSITVVGNYSSRWRWWWI